ncbi:MAG TPA: hypothetical protein VMR45_04075 [Patescibacteria group bacterium]|nr:hypothetical protein [Patescibacteria group bacterium]
MTNNYSFPAAESSGAGVSDIAAAVQHVIECLPLGITNESAQNIQDTAEELSGLASGSTTGPLEDLQSRLGTARLGLIQASGTLSLAAEELQQYLANIGADDSCPPSVLQYDINQATKENLPPRIREAFQSIYDLLDLPQDADIDSITDHEERIRDNGSAIAEALGREDTVDEMLEALLSIDSDDLEPDEQIKFGTMPRWDLLKGVDLCDCMVNLDKITVAGRPKRLEKILRFVSNPQPWTLAQQKGARLFEKYFDAALAEGVDFSQFGKILAAEKNIALLCKAISTDSIVGDRAKEIWLNKALIAKSAIKAGIRYWNDDSKVQLDRALTRLYGSAYNFFRDDMLVAMHKSSPLLFELEDSWGDGSLIASLLALAELEQLHPGFGTELFDMFGIRRFEKYPTSQLLGQYEYVKAAAKRLKAQDSQAQNIPWMAAAVSVDDEEEAYGDRAEELGRIKEQIKAATGQEVQICIYEFGSPHQLLRALFQMRLLARRCGPAVFGTMLSHGSEDATFRTGRFEADISKNDIDNQYGPVIAGIISENSTVSMESCHSGSPGGVAEQIARISGRRVIGPLETSYPIGSSVEGDINNLRIQRTYEGYSGAPVVTMSYGG